jgi:anaerobic C4-dicarboxylate transporter
MDSALAFLTGKLNAIPIPSDNTFRRGNVGNLETRVIDWLAAMVVDRFTDGFTDAIRFLISYTYSHILNLILHVLV